jgi:hypothetical protein
MHKGRAAVNKLEGFFNLTSSDIKHEANAIPGAAAMRVLFVLILVFFLSPNAQAQLYTGSVTGVVSDPSGAVVPSAKVTLVDQNKGYTFTAATDPATGRYLLRSIPPGTYKITVEAPNFQGQTREGMTLDVNQNLSIDFSLKVGTANEVVEVKGAGVQLQTEDAVTGQVVNRRFVSDLPLVDRVFADLVYLAPGVVETNAPGTRGSQGGINFNSNGGRNATADVLIDGASASNFDQNSGINNVPYNPSVDSVEEFKVQQTNFTAEYGFAGGTIINVVTRSGTNQFHGSLYEFFRNSVMDANDWFSNAQNPVVPISPLKRNNFGGTVGGPIRKDKTFFFFDYEGTRQTTASSSGLMGVPSLCERGQGPCPAGANALGNFSELCTTQADSFGNNAHFNAQGQCVDSQNNSFPSGQLWDPYSGTFQNTPNPLLDPNVTLGAGAVRNTIIPFNDLSSYTSLPTQPGSVTLAAAGAPGLPSSPGNLIDPVARKLFLLFPQPKVNATDLFTLQNANFFSAGGSTSSQDQFDLKVDHRFSDRDMLSARYSQARGSSTSLNCFGNFVDPCTGGPVNFTRHEAAVNYSHTFSPRVALTVTYGLVRGFDFQHGVQGQFSNISSLFTQLGFPAYLNNFGTIPAIQISGYSSGNAGNNIGTQTFSVLREGQDAHHLEGAVSWVRGKHELKFGGEGRLHRINFVQPGWPSGDFSFDSTATSEVASESNTTSAGFPFLGGDGLASFLTGVGSPNLSGGGCTPCQQGFNNFVSTQSIRFGTFVQDNFKVTPKLTLNLGMRYELSFPRTERFNRMNWLDPNTASPVQLSAPQLAVVQSLGLPAQAVQTLSSLHGIEVFSSPKDRSNYYADYKNIQPRFGFAYQLPHSFVVRGGYGIYFDTPRNSAAGTGPWGFEGFNIQPPWLTTFNIDHVTPYNRLSNTACLFFAPFNCGLALPPSTLRTFNAFNDLGFAAVGPIRQESLNTPYEQAWSLGFQKELPGRILVDATYVGKKGTHLYLGGFREHNYIPPSFLTGMTPTQIGNLTNTVTNPFFFNGPGNLCDPTKFICDPSSGLAGPTITLSQLLVPFPQYNGFQGDSPPIANSIYHAVQVRAEKEFSNGLQFLVTYSWSKSLDNASAGDDSFSFLGGGTPGGSTLTVQNPFNLAAERAVSVFDLPQLLQLSYVYELPVGRGRLFGRQMNPILNAVVGGWQTNGIVRIDNGRPIIPLISNGTAIPTYGLHPDLTGTLQRASGSPEASVDTNANPTSYFANSSLTNSGVLSTPASFTFGSAPRTIASVRQPGARDVSMSLFKEFPLAKVREGMRLEFRAESFNTFNHPHFQGPNATVGSNHFGLISSTVNSPRELQLALKLYF